MSTISSLLEDVSALREAVLAAEAQHVDLLTNVRERHIVSARTSSTTSRCARTICMTCKIVSPTSVFPHWAGWKLASSATWTPCCALYTHRWTRRHHPNRLNTTTFALR